jgi:serine/threonine-protein kinase
MGVVLSAWDIDLGRTVAVKLPCLACWAGSAFGQVLVNERRHAGLVRHRNVVAVYDLVTPAGGLPFLVLEYVPGGSLPDLLRRQGPLPPRQATRLLASALRALRATHAAGLVHRDVKPGNLLVCGNELKLADFGLASALTPSGVTAAGPISGTPCYMSPEQAGGEPLDPRSDLYSLGLTYGEMLTGVRPDPQAHTQELLRRHALPAACAAIVRQAAAPQPSQRYASAREMLAAVKAALTRLPAEG